MIINNFLSLILFLEIYSLSVFFALVKKSKDAAVRFILNSALMTSLIFMGASLYYAENKTLLFLPLNNVDSSLLITSIILITCGLFFKIGISPFHLWLVDLYKNAPIKLLFFLDSVWKFVLLFIFTDMLNSLNIIDYNIFKIIIVSVSYLSLIAGSICPIFKKDIKEFLAYNSIGHLGVALAAISVVAIKQALMYVCAYCIFSALFLFSLLLLKKKQTIEQFSDMSSLMKTKPIVGTFISVSLFSIAGLPPSIPFFIKIQLIQKIINSEDFLTVIMVVIFSFASIYYTSKHTRYLFKQ